MAGRFGMFERVGWGGVKRVYQLFGMFVHGCDRRDLVLRTRSFFPKYP